VTATLRQGEDAAAVLVPVAPGLGTPAVATSVATLDEEPAVARSNSSDMPAGGVNVAVALQAPPKTSSVPPVLVVIEGPVTDVERVVLRCEPEALIGEAELAPDTARIPPAMSCPEPPVRVNVYEAGSLGPLSLYHPWMRALLPSARSAFGTAVHPVGGARLR
jgi:hypothetical protein